YRAAAARDRRVRYVRHETNRGALANFEFVRAEARGEYFKWAADDDVHHPRNLASLVAALAGRPEASSAGSGLVLTHPSGFAIRCCGFAAVSAHPSVTKRIGAIRARDSYMDVYGLHRKAALDRTRELPAINGADYLLVLELLLLGPIVRVEEELLRYRD